MKPARRANTPREWALAIGGGLALSASLVWVLRSDEPMPTPTLAAVPTPAPTPPPAPVAAAPVDLKLAGLRAGPDGGMAIVAAGGRQYLLRPGRVMPGGIKLLRVEPGRAILAGPAGEMVLAFADSAPASAPSRAGPPTLPGGDPTPWQLALSPMKQGGRIAGWRLDTLASLPALARAGLRPGDVLVSANGSELISEEKIMELPQELATNGRLQIGYRRGNQLREAVVSR